MLHDIEEVTYVGSRHLVFTFHLGGSGSHLFCKGLTLSDSLDTWSNRNLYL